MGMEEGFRSFAAVAVMTAHLLGNLPYQSDPCTYDSCQSDRWKTFRQPSVRKNGDRERFYRLRSSEKDQLISTTIF